MIDPDYLREHYGGLSNEALMGMDRGELVELARAIYDEEIERRRLGKHEVLAKMPSALAGPVSPRLRDLRRLALVACVGTLLGVAMPIWNLTVQVFSLESNIGQSGTIAVFVVLYLFAVVPLLVAPLFYFALYRDEGDLPVSRNMGRMAMVAAVVTGIVVVVDISRWVGSFRQESVTDFTGRSWMIGDTATALGEVANLVSIVLLVALFRVQSDRSERGIAVSKLLRVATKMAMITGVIVAVGCVVGLAATPWVYSYTQDRLLEMGYPSDRWMFWRLAADRVRAALGIICMFVAPFIVWWGSRAGGATDYTSSGDS